MNAPRRRRHRERPGDWVVCDFGHQPPGALCRRCGRRLEIPLPIELDVLAAMGKAFVKAHKGCRPQAPGEVRGC